MSPGDLVRVATLILDDAEIVYYNAARALGLGLRVGCHEYEGARNFYVWKESK